MSEHYRRAEELSKILARIDEVAPGDLSPDVLAPLDQFHSGGLAATRDLSRLAAIKLGEAVLDVGCGVGGPARVLAAEHGARVRAVDLAPAFIAIARALSQKSGISVGFEAAPVSRMENFVSAFQRTTFVVSFSQSRDNWCFF